MLANNTSEESDEDAIEDQFSSEHSSSFKCRKKKKIPKTVGAILKEVCENPNIPDEKVPEAFLTSIANVLLQIKHLYPSYCRQIYCIASEVLKLGMSCNEHSKIAEDPALKDKLDRDIAFNTISRLYENDKKIQSLMEEKLTLYLNILHSDSAQHRETDSELNMFNHILSEVSDQDKNNCSERLKGKKRRRNDFSSMTIDKAAAHNEEQVNILKQETLANIKCESMEDHDMVQPEHPVMSDVPQTFSTLESEKNQTTNVIFSSRVSYNTEGAIVSSMKAFRKGCLAGSTQGQLLTFSKTGVLCDSIPLHKSAVTSVAIWKPKIMTTSLDGTVCYYDVETRLRKTVDIGTSVTCSREYKGILYLGTSTGHIAKYNIRSFTMIGEMVQVATGKIRDIEVMDIDDITVVAVASENKSVLIRTAETGSLLWCSKFLNDVNALTSVKSKKNYLFGVNQEGTVLTHFDKGREQLISHDLHHGGGHLVAENNGNLFFASTYGNIYIYSDEGIFLSCLCGTGEPITSLAVDRKRVIFSTKTTVTSIPREEDNVNL